MKETVDSSVQRALLGVQCRVTSAIPIEFKRSSVFLCFPLLFSRRGSGCYNSNCKRSPATALMTAGKLKITTNKAISFQSENRSKRMSYRLNADR